MLEFGMELEDGLDCSGFGIDQEWESGLMKQMARFTEYSVVGRKLPTEADQNPKL